MSELTPQAKELLSWLHTGGEHAYYWRGDNKQSAWFAAGQPIDPPTETNLYFGVHPANTKRGSNQRARTADIAAVNCLFAEFDAKDYGGKDEAYYHVLGLEYPPQVLIDSGNGFHCYWLTETVYLNTDEERERIRKLQAAWVEYNGGDPGAKDLARVLRVPGTLNTKYTPPRPVTVLWADYDIQYPLSHLEAALNGAGKNNEPKQAETDSNYHRPAREDAASFWLDKAIQQAAPGNRNRVGFWLACQLRDAGLSETEALEVGYPEAMPRGDHPYTRNDWKTTVRSTYERPPRQPAKNKERYSTPAGTPATYDRKPLDLTAIIEAESHNEAGDADLFALMFAGQICYDHAARSWFTWHGHYWKEDKTNVVYSFVTRQLAAAYMRGAGDALEADKKDAAARLSKRANLLQAKKRADNVIAFAAAHEKIAVEGDEWDANPWLLGVENGVINLQTGEYRPGRPGDYIRAHAPTKWHGIDEPAPRWGKFISEIFNNDQQLAAFVQRVLGYGITGSTREHALPVFYGPLGRNGKSTLGETLGNVLGDDLATSTQADAIMDIKSNSGEGPKPFIFALRGKRLVWASESNEGRRLNSGLVKQLTGGDRLNVRTLHSKPVQFEPSHLLLLITNHRPHIPADDDAIWDRVFLIPFTMRFVDKPGKPNERQADKALKEKLRTEAPGILAWLVRGCLEWQRMGLEPPDSVKAATEEYRTEEDTLAQFIAECCILAPNVKARGGELWTAYTAWAEDSAIRPMNKNLFGQRLKQRFELIPPKNVITYGGIGLKTLDT